MRLEDQVVSLPLAKRLKELGVKQEGTFVWSVWDNDDRLAELNRDDGTLDDAPGIEDFSAFTVAELLNGLPVYIMQDGTPFYFRILRENGDSFTVGYYMFDETKFYALREHDPHSLENALAQLKISLIEQKLVTP